MIRLKPFLDNYDLLLFDMDGVITSEQAYWTCAALTVYEMRHSKAHFGTEQVNRSAMLAERERIRREVFLDDSVIALLKDKGVNSNWDLAYVTLCAVLSEGSYEKAYATAVPCWSSWNTGISHTRLSFSSISKQRGAEMSSKLIPPNDPASKDTVRTISSGSFERIQSGNASTPAKRLNSAHFPSITGIPASGPMSPRPSTAVPSVTTATWLPRRVYV